MTDTVVIVPFYQREPGILARSLDCIFAQTYKDLAVLIVDDESPLSPAAEVECRPAGERARIKIVVRKNGGPGSARNAGLDAAGAEIRHVAFLDSDDVWAKDHLQHAVDALRLGYEFYFSDYTWPSRSSTRFRQTRLVDLGTAVGGDGKLFALDTDFFEVVLSLWPVHISATVIDARALGDIRFDPRLRLSSEDQMYFLECAGKTGKVCFRDEVTMRLDDGLNIFRRQPVGTFGFSRSRIANAYFHRLVQPLADERSTAATARNRELFRTNVKDFARSEAKSLVFNRRIHPSLYWLACRVFLGRQLPDSALF